MFTCTVQMIVQIVTIAVFYNITEKIKPSSHCQRWKLIWISERRGRSNSTLGRVLSLVTIQKTNKIRKVLFQSNQANGCTYNITSFCSETYRGQIWSFLLNRPSFNALMVDSIWGTPCPLSRFKMRSHAASWQL